MLFCACEFFTLPPQRAWPWNEMREKIKLEEKVKSALEKIRPMLQADGGDVEFVCIEDNVVKVRLTGACGSCPMSQMTLKMGVEEAIKEVVPEIKEVVSV